jgi:hypothetical protein
MTKETRDIVIGILVGIVLAIAVIGLAWFVHP